MPHGTMAANAFRSQSQLSAKPCSVVARDTRTPMAPTLRAGRPAPPGTQTPERPTDRDRVYVFAEGFLPPEYVAGFDPPRIVARFPLEVRGTPVTVFWLLEYARPAGSAAAGRLDRTP